MSSLSELSMLTNIVSHSSDHACIRKCRSGMKCRDYTLSLLPSQFLGMRSLIRNGFERAGFLVTLRNAVLMLCNISVLPLAVSFSSVRNCCITSTMSCFNCSWKVTMSAAVTMPVHDLLLRLLLLRNLESLNWLHP